MNFYAVTVRVTPFEKAVIYGEGGIGYYVKHDEFGWISNDDGPIDPALEALAMSTRAHLLKRS